MMSRIRPILDDPQVRAGIDLATGAGLNAVTGLGFWFVAARTFDEATVGINAALISTMMLVATLSTLGLSNGLIRFVPGYGASARSLVLRCYGLSALVVLVLAPVAATVFGQTSDELEVLASPIGIAGFTLAALLWVIFVLQDSVLVAIGKTKVIPIENGAHSILKLLLLMAFAATKPPWGIFVAFVLPVLALLVVVNRIAFRRLSQPDYLRSKATPESGIAQFARGEYLALVVNIALTGSIPLIVLAVRGEEAAAFYAMAWAVAYTLILVNESISSALLAEAARTPARLPLQAAKAARQMATLVIPGSMALFVAAPYILQVLGSSYASEATTLLRLLAATAVANIVVSVAVGWLRSTRNVGKLVIVNGARSLLILAIGVPLLSAYGLPGLGIGWLVGETLLALALMATLLRPLALQLVPRTVVLALSAARSGSRRAGARRRLKRLAWRREFGDAGTPQLLSASSDRAVFNLGGDEILKAAWSDLSRDSLDSEAANLQWLHRDPRLAAFVSIVPRFVRSGEVGGTRWFAQKRAGGIPVASRDHQSFLPIAAEAISPLHDKTAEQARVERDVIRRVVTYPIEAIIATQMCKSTELNRLHDRLYAELVDIGDLYVSTIHGDYAPANVLVSPATGEVSAILDWEMCREQHLPEVDLGHLINALAAEAANAEYGTAFVRYLKTPETAPVTDMLAYVRSRSPNRLSDVTILTLAWLDHVAMNLQKSDSYKGNPIWFNANVRAVLTVLDEMAAANQTLAAPS